MPSDANFDDIDGYFSMYTQYGNQPLTMTERIIVVFLCMKIWNFQLDIFILILNLWMDRKESSQQAQKVSQTFDNVFTKCGCWKYLIIVFNIRILHIIMECEDNELWSIL